MTSITLAAEHLHQGLQVSAVPVLPWEITQPLTIGVKLPLCSGQPYNCLAMKQRQQALKKIFQEASEPSCFPLSSQLLEHTDERKDLQTPTSACKEFCCWSWGKTTTARRSVWGVCHQQRARQHLQDFIHTSSWWTWWKVPLFQSCIMNVLVPGERFTGFWHSHFTIQMLLRR